MIVNGPSTGVIQLRIEEIRVGLESVEEAKKGELCSVRVGTKLRRSDKVYKLVDAALVKAQ